MDRNTIVLAVLLMYSWSLSARRAWIEILSAQGHKNQTFVALRKESVDRNHDDYLKLAKFEGSLSARRAWIEMRRHRGNDRRPISRSPQGERG